MSVSRAGLSRAKRKELREGPVLSQDVRWRWKFLQTLLDSECDVEKAAKAAGIVPVVAYQAARRDADFAQDWDEIREIVKERRADAIEAAMSKRAIEGTPYRRYDRDGNLLEEAVEFDTLAQATILRAYRPKDFREKSESALDGIRSVSDLFRAVAEAERVHGKSLLPPPPDQVPAIDAGPLIVTKREPPN